MINRLRIIRKAMKVVRNTGDTEKAYNIISQAFGREKNLDMLDFNSARSKLEQDAEKYKVMINESISQSEGKD